MIAPETRRAIKARAKEILDDDLIELGAGAIAGDEALARAARQAAAERGLVGEELAAAVNAALDDFVGYGPFQPLLDDPDIDEVYLDPGGRNPDGSWREEHVWVELGGKTYPRPDVYVGTPDEVGPIIQRIAEDCGGRRCDESSPLLNAFLPDGTRVNAVHPKNSPDGYSLNMRKHGGKSLGPADLVARGAASPEMMAFLKSCVIGCCSIIISGGTGSGKTTMLNALASFFPDSDHVVTVEDTLELQIREDRVDSPWGNNVTRLQSSDANYEGEGAKSIHDLVVNSLRMRPERLIVGECRDSETYDMLQAMQTGHDGSLTTIHASGPIGAFIRLESMIVESRPNISEDSVRRQIGYAVDLIVHVHRSRKDGSRRITSITAVEGFSDGNIVRNELFRWNDRDQRFEALQQQSMPIKEKILDADAPYDPAWFGIGGTSW